MDTEKILKELKSNLKALVLTERNGYTVPKLYGHYRELMGKDIREESGKLGYGSLEAFLDSQYDIVRKSRNKEGEEVYKGVADSTTQHMANLVANTPAQRKKKKGSKSRSRGHGMRGGKGGMGGRGGAWGGSTGRGGFGGSIGSGRGGNVGRGFSRGQVDGRGAQQSRGGGTVGQTEFGKESYCYHKNALEKFFSKNNLGQIPYKVSVAGTRFVAAVSVNGKEFKTYPQSFTTEADALEGVSKLCVTNLNILKDGSVMKESNDKVMLVYRIEKFVANKVNGVFSTVVEKQYEKQYKEQLPNLWWEKIKSNNVVRVEPYAPGSNVMLVYPADQGEVSTEPAINEDYQPQVDENRNVSEDLYQELLNGEGELPAMNGESLLPDLTLPSETLWDVYVTFVASSGEISLRLIGPEYSERFDSMSTNMDQFYADSSIPSVSEFVPGKIYAANVSGGWHRVQALSPGEAGAAVCLFIDDGDEDVVNNEDVKELDPIFLKVPAQATYVSLHGLEDTIEDDYVTEKLKDELVGKSLIAQVMDVGNETDLTSVILYDTSSEEDVNINKMIIDDWENTDGSTEDSETSNENDSHKTKLLDILEKELDVIEKNMNAMEIGNKLELDLGEVKTEQNKPTKKPGVADINRRMKPMKTFQIPDIESDLDVNVLSTSSPSNFIVQPLEHVDSLARLMIDLCEYYDNPANLVFIYSGVAVGDVFAVRHHDKLWYRVMVTKMRNATHWEVQDVDYGRTQVVGTGELQPLVERFRELLCLAIKAKLTGVKPFHGEWTPDEKVGFSLRVEGRQFVSRIKGAETSVGGGDVLELELIDTSDPYEDKYISQELGFM